MASLTTYGVSKTPFNGLVGSQLQLALSNYGTLVGGVVANAGGSGWGYLHLYDASNVNQVVPGQTPPKLIVPVNFGTSVPLMLGPGVTFNEGCVAFAAANVNSSQGAANQLAVSLVFNTQPTD